MSSRPDPSFRFRALDYSLMVSIDGGEASVACLVYGAEKEDEEGEEKDGNYGFAGSGWLYEGSGRLGDYGRGK